jgi:DNA-binding MarR family transcriptional regulator
LPTSSTPGPVLEGRGWIERSADEHDRRRVALRLTSDGRETVKSVLTYGIEQLAQTLSVATGEELDTIETGMQALQAALSRAHETFGYRHCRRDHHLEESTR